MTAGGTLRDVNDTITENPATNNIDSMEKLLEERQRQLEQDQKRLQDMKQQENSGVNTSTTMDVRRKKQLFAVIPFIPAII